MSKNDTISFISLNTPEKRALLEQTFDDLKKIVDKSEFILGSFVPEFEKQFAVEAGCKFGIGVNSGLDALILPLRTFGVGEGDEVITAPNSFVASAAAIALVGARPVFVDVDDDYNLNPDLLEKAINNKTKAIMPVHLTGNPCKMDKITAIAQEHGLHIIEDAAQAIGAKFDGKPVGSFSTAAGFSLHPLKNLHIWGDGGMIVTNDESVANNLKLQRNHGLKNRDEVEFFSYNSRLDTIQAAVGLNHLKLLKATTEKRIANAMLYNSRLAELSEFITPPKYDAAKAKHVFHVYQTRATRRDELKTYLQDHGIETKVHYPIPIHWQKASSYLGYRRGDFPMCDKLAGEILSLPVRENLTPDEIHRVCDTVTSFYKR